MVTTKVNSMFNWSLIMVANLLPFELRCLSELSAFKSGLKTYLFSLDFEGINPEV